MGIHLPEIVVMNQTSIPFTSSLRVRKGHDVEEDQDDDDEDNLPLDEQGKSITLSMGGHL